MSLPSKDLDELKSDAERLSKQLPRSSSKDEALEVAIEAAELSMQALKLARNKDEKALLSTRVKQLLDEAERIKRSKDWRTVAHSTPVANGSAGGVATGNNKSKALEAPVSSRELPTSEKVLLLKAGYLNGFKFPPWSQPPEPNEFELRESEELFLYVSLMIHMPRPQLTVYLRQRHTRATSVRVSRRRA